MIRTALKFLFRVYVSFSNPAYIDWRRQLRTMLSKVLLPSDKIFLILLAITLLTVVLEITGYPIWILVTNSYEKFEIQVFVTWLLSTCSFIVSGCIWFKGFLKHLIRLQIFRISLYRSYAWGLFVLGAALQVALFSMTLFDV